MHEEMTSRERLKTALSNHQPDRVPVTPDISNLVPCRLTGRPFWEIHYLGTVSHYEATLEAARYFGFDGWFGAGISFKTKTSFDSVSEVVKKEDDRWTVKWIHHTPDGDLEEVRVYPKADAPVSTEKMIKNFKEDLPKFRHMYPEITGYDDSLYRQQMKDLGDMGLFNGFVQAPGLNIYVNYFNGNLEATTYAYYDEPELFEELRQIHERHTLQKIEAYAQCGVDCVMIGSSGSITIQSPEIWRNLTLPTIKKVSRMCREAGILCGVHSCGKERYIAETFARETDVSFVNPLEIPPMGDCILTEVKKSVGHRLALMGNLHTTSVMLMGTPDTVLHESLKAIRDGGEGGGFVLSTGDQCGRDTPDENIFAMVRAAKEFGRYPLDMDMIQKEINLIEKNL